MNIPLTCAALLVGLSAAAGAGDASTSDTDYHDMTLEELLHVTMAVATKSEGADLRSSPAILTLVTSEEIRSSGARELKDVLQLVPGLYLGMNDTGVIGLGSRGHWAFEAKALLLVDGVEMLDVHSGSFQFGNHYPVDQIERIEIIRGPGSAIYGGSAELVVINIVTRSGAQLSGAEAGYTYGRMDGGLARSNGSLAFGGRVGEDLQFSLSALVGEGQRSDRSYTDFFGNTYSLAGQSNLNPTFANLGVSYRGFELRAILDEYHTTAADSRLNGANLSEAEQLDLDSKTLRAKYRFELGSKVSFEPYFLYKWNEPWKTLGAKIPALDYALTYHKATEGVDFRWQPLTKLSVLAGAELSQIEGIQHTGNWTTTGTDRKTLDVGAVYVQGLLDAGFANLNVGGRYEGSQGSPAAFVPRIGATRVFGRWHVKALYGEGFKTPTLVQHDLALPGNEIRPEKTRVAEVEAGYRLGATVWAAVNLFHTSLHEPIVYDPAFGFANSGDVATRGLEAQLRAKDRWGFATLAYSYYRKHSNDAPIFAVPGQDDVLLGLPAHKLTAAASVSLDKDRLHIGPTLVLYGPRYGYEYQAATGGPGLSRFDPMCLVSVYVSRENLLAKGLSLGFGVFNIFDTPEVYPQPYDAGHGPLPETSREFLVRLGYRTGS